MKPQPICSRPYSYYAYADGVDASVSGVNRLCEDVSLRGLIARLHALSQGDVTKVHIDVAIEGWPFDVGVPRGVYADGTTKGWMLKPVELVPEHWDFPAPYIYFALDWQRGIWLESPTLHNLVSQLHETGHTFVSSLDLKIGARFARENSQREDVVQVPLSLVCHNYDPEDDDVVVIDEGWDEDDRDDEFTLPCSPLPLKAELLPAECVPPHFFFGDRAIQYRRLQQLANDQ